MLFFCGVGIIWFLAGAGFDLGFLGAFSGGWVFRFCRLVLVVRVGWVYGWCDFHVRGDFRIDFGVGSLTIPRFWC